MFFNTRTNATPLNKRAAILMINVAVSINITSQFNFQTIYVKIGRRGALTLSKELIYVCVVALVEFLFSLSD